MSEITGRPGAWRGGGADPHDDDAPVVAVLEAYWEAAPAPDVEALWSRIAPGLGPQPPPPRPWYRRALPAAVALTTSRAVAIGAGAAVIAAALLVGAVALRPQQDASAAVLEAVQGLSAATDDAFDDDTLSPDETEQLRQRAAALLDEIGGSEDALAGLSADELSEVVARLEGVLTRISTYRAERPDGDGELEEAEHSVRQVASAFDEERGRRGESDAEDGLGSGSSGSGGDDHEDDTRPIVVPSVSPGGSATATPGVTSTASPTATPAAEGGDTEHESEHEDEHEGEGSASATSTPVAPSPSPSPSATATAPAPLPPNTSEAIPAVAGEYDYAVGDAGAVRLAFDGDETLEVLAATPSPGWVVFVEERDGSEVRVVFARDGLRARFEAAREDGRIEISIRWSD